MHKVLNNIASFHSWRIIRKAKVTRTQIGSASTVITLTIPFARSAIAVGLALARKISKTTYKCNTIKCTTNSLTTPTMTLLSPLLLHRIQCPRHRYLLLIFIERMRLLSQHQLRVLWFPKVVGHVKLLVKSGISCRERAA